MTAVMADSALSRTLTPTPGHIQFLYSVTCEPGDQPPILGTKESGVRTVLQIAREETDPDDDDDDDDCDPAIVTSSSSAVAVAPSTAHD